MTVQYDACDGHGWDSHVHSDDVKDHLLPTFDQALSVLLIDLNERGLVTETPVAAIGEMGRTPLASSRWGRGRWTTLLPAVLAGAGIRDGIVYGGSDKNAVQPIDRPVSPDRLAATIDHAVGIDPQMRLLDPQGRPVPIVEQAEPRRVSRDGARTGPDHSLRSATTKNFLPSTGFDRSMTTAATRPSACRTCDVRGDLV